MVMADSSTPGLCAQVEIARLYQEAKVNPLAGCLPTLITLPVWIGLYRALSNVADEGLLTDGFFWIPSLAGPTSMAAQKAVSILSLLESSCKVSSSSQGSCEPKKLAGDPARLCTGLGYLEIMCFPNALRVNTNRHCLGLATHCQRQSVTVASSHEAYAEHFHTTTWRM